MEKEFIPYEQALALKQLGFDEPCIALYKNSKFRFEIKDCNGIADFYNRDGNIIAYLAPLYQQAFRWFIEKYNLWSNTYPNNWYVIRRPIDEISANEWSSKLTSYKEAELECLKKLIEIAKRNG